MQEHKSLKNLLNFSTFSASSTSSSAMFHFSFLMLFKIRLAKFNAGIVFLGSVMFLLSFWTPAKILDKIGRNKSLTSSTFSRFKIVRENSILCKDCTAALMLAASIFSDKSRPNAFKTLDNWVPICSKKLAVASLNLTKKSFPRPAP